MRNFKMFCLTLDPDHYGFIKKLGYTPVGLGEKHFNENCFTSKFRFGRLIPAILVDQKFIILQGLHILGEIQVATPLRELSQ